MAIPSSHINLLGIKYRYHPGQRVQIRQVPESKKQDPDNIEYQWKSGVITKLHENFMTVRTKNYTTAVLYKDILLGTVKVK